MEGTKTTCYSGSICKDHGWTLIKEIHVRGSQMFDHIHKEKYSIFFFFLKIKKNIVDYVFIVYLVLKIMALIIITRLN